MTEILIVIDSNTPISRLIKMQKHWSKEFSEVTIIKGKK